jgi:hypothetical protein
MNVEKCSAFSQKEGFAFFTVAVVPSGCDALSGRLADQAVIACQHERNPLKARRWRIWREIDAMDSSRAEIEHHRADNKSQKSLWGAGLRQNRGFA